MDVIYRDYTITLYLSGAGTSLTTQMSASNNQEAARFLVGIHRSIQTGGTVTCHMRNMSSLVQAANIIMVSCEPALTETDMTHAEEWLDT
jgi:hypothetical protein